MRNPENIDLSKYPPPPGYVVASEGDCRGLVYVPIGWLALVKYSQKRVWVAVCVKTLGFVDRWTYLRPITPDDQGDKYDTDHMFPG